MDSRTGIGLPIHNLRAVLKLSAMIEQNWVVDGSGVQTWPDPCSGDDCGWQGRLTIAPPPGLSVWHHPMVSVKFLCRGLLTQRWQDAMSTCTTAWRNAKMSLITTVSCLQYAHLFTFHDIVFKSVLAPKSSSSSMTKLMCVRRLEFRRVT